MQLPNIITLDEARRRLGENVVICLEPDEVRGAKIGGGKGAELWCFDPATGRSGRIDGKFHDARIVSRGNYNQIALYEEPSVLAPADGGPRVVGHVIIEKNRGGLVHVRKAKGLNGEVLELMPSSISKGQLAEKGLEPVGFIESNPQRIIGMIAVYVVEADFPDAEGMTPDEFRKQSTDGGRSLAALDKARL